MDENESVDLSDYTLNLDEIEEQKKKETETKRKKANKTKIETKEEIMNGDNTNNSKLESFLSEDKKDSKDEIPYEPENEENVNKEESENDDSFVLESDIEKDSETKEEEYTEEDDKELMNEINLSESISVPKLNIEEIENNDKKQDDFVISQNKSEKVVDTVKNDKEETIRQKLERRHEKETGYKVYGGENGNPSSYASDNPFTDKFKDKTIPSEKIRQVRKDEELEQLFLNTYINNSNGAISPRITRIPLLLSGYYAEITNYTYGDLAGIIRISRNPDLRFLRRFQEELISIYNHISWTSLTKPGERLSFDDWCAKTLFPDLDQFYYGGFDATFPGESKYNIVCGRCHQPFDIVRTNRQLCYALQNSGDDSLFNDLTIKNILLGKTQPSSMKNISVYKKAHELYEGKVITPNNIKVSYGVPSIFDVLEYLTVFEEILSSSFEDFGDLMDESSPNHNILKMYTYIKKLTVPVVIGKNKEGKDIIDFYCVDTTIPDDNKRIENRKQIITILNRLPKDSFSQLFKGKEVAEKVKLKGIQHMIHNIKCPTCGVNITRVKIDMQTNFFTEAAQTVDLIEQY